MKTSGKTIAIIVVLAIGAVVALGVGGFFALTRFINAQIASSRPYQMALEQVQADTRVQEKLGTPITAKAMVRGRLQTQDDDGIAELSIPISGPQDSAVIELKATRANKIWTIQHLLVQTTTGDYIPLIAQAPSEQH
jgi:hypothetical protein